MDIDTLFLGERMERAVTGPLGRGEVAVFSMPCPGIDGRENEDSAAVLLVDPQRQVLAVADGVGGVPGGRQASARALKSFTKTLRAAFTAERGLRASILDGLEAANRAVLDLGAGCTTIAVVAIRSGVARCVHVGDSGVLVVGQRGRIKHQTVAHSPVGYAVESGLLAESDAMTHEDRNLVSNVLGSDAMKIEIGPQITLGARDTVLLASDGVLDNVDTEELTELVRRGPIERAAADLAALCRTRMADPVAGAPSKPDDTTFVIYRPTARRRRPTSGRGKSPETNR